MPRGINCSCTIRRRSSAKSRDSGTVAGFCLLPVATNAARIRNCGILRTRQSSLSFRAKSRNLSILNLMSEEHKTPEMRAQMTDIERLRHSASHVLATAILKIWPEAQFAAGPPVENGFYYDVDLAHRISPEDFPRIEEEMKKEVKANHVFQKEIVTREQALADARSGKLAALGERGVE